MAPSNEVIFGWDAPPMAEQHPVIPSEVAAHFDKDNEALIRLSVRGLITPSQKMAGFKRLTKNIEAAIREALRHSS